MARQGHGRELLGDLVRALPRGNAGIRAGAERRTAPKGLQFVGIAVDQPDKVRQFEKEIGLNYPSLIGGFGAMELSKTLGNNIMALPFSVVVDRQGKIAHTQLGVLKPGKLEVILKQLL